MTKWIMSANPLIFDHKLAFDMNGFIDWNQTRKFTVGDIVYIYSSKSVSKVQFKAYVEKINMSADEVVDNSIFWKKDNVEKKKKYMRLRLLKYLDCDELSLENLRNHGMKYVPQSPCFLKPELQEYIEKYFGGITDE